ncbi:hypothetical protein EVAR_13815_1 [Eumeta japonica]|uniref:Uncharacterized protein n=1 Tax=Eumeta variegata TaxID=151549 RepID=A0A4C1U1I3_EUMVA|nr:hypothetical protein EVAR_13815_1 [Eumeta japonica]
MRAIASMQVPDGVLGGLLGDDGLLGGLLGYDGLTDDLLGDSGLLGGLLGDISRHTSLRNYFINARVFVVPVLMWMNQLLLGSRYREGNDLMMTIENVYGLQELQININLRLIGHSK